MLPATQVGTGSHASVVAFHLKAGAVHAQLVWPVNVLLMYPVVVGQTRQEVALATPSDATVNSPAPQGEQMASAM